MGRLLWVTPPEPTALREPRMGAVGDDVGDDDKGVFGGVEGRVSCLLVRWTAHVWSLVPRPVQQIRCAPNRHSTFQLHLLTKSIFCLHLHRSGSAALPRIQFSTLEKMPPTFSHDRWPHPTSGTPQNPQIWTHSQSLPRQLPPRHMDDRIANPTATRLRTGSNYDPYAAEAEYGPYYLDEQHFVSAPFRDFARDEYTHTRRDGLVIGSWMRSASDDGVAAQLTGRIEMLSRRIGAVEGSHEEDWDNPLPSHQAVRWAYPAENRPGFWETGYGHGPHRHPQRPPVVARNPPGSAFQPVVSSSSLIRHNLPPPVALPPTEADVPPAPVTGHKVYILDCKSCGTFLSNRGMKARFHFSCLIDQPQLTLARQQAVLLLRPNIALFSTDAMPVNCSPQPFASQQPTEDAFDKHPQDITDIIQKSRRSSSVQRRSEEVLYASYFLPPKCAPADMHPESATPERSADIASAAHPMPTHSLPRTCECLTQTLSCHGCGAGIGYMIVTPCARCTAQQSVSGRPGQPQRTANGHRFVFHHAEIVARERLYIPGQPGVHRYPWGIPPTSSAQQSPALVQQADSRARVASVDSEPKSPSIPVFQPHRDGNFVPILSQVPARTPTRRVQNTGLKAGDVVFWHHLGRTGELGGVSLDGDHCTRDYVER
ncbi:hypothetical protein CTheo_7978 [Ceratobasidium theobromae]|uniref:Uncharacterized protein n=1 Tax=Ceratobasidium theobromae TaxID=1582974 RepID=A0A5N5Q9Y9_9AGAM|nr:hypothetical protein CTheo_7978 [Ceratobasidium theobromae]